jgi:hypothetical protein
MVWTGLVIAWLLGASWSVATTPTPPAFPAWQAPFIALDVTGRGTTTQVTHWPTQEANEPRGSSEDTVEPSTPKPRGIRPPWRENAIPELRRQPGQKQKTTAA